MAFNSLFAKLFARYVVQSQKSWYTQSEAIQKKIFQSLIIQAQNTEFGRDHRFHEIQTHKDYVQRVPIRDYEQIREYIKRILAGEKDILWKGKPLYLSKTSGTTSGAKYIPISKESIKYHIRSARDAILYYIFQMPGKPNFTDYKMIFLSGSPTLIEKNGILSGRLSGIAHHHIPAYLQRNKLPSYETNCIDDWETKLGKIVDETIDQKMSVISGITPWIQMYFDWLREKSGKNIKQLFPHLQLIIHGGVNFQPYQKAIAEVLGGNVDTIETYPASEGFIAFQDTQTEPGLLLLVNNGIFYEFVETQDLEKENPKRYTLGQIKIGKNYAIILTTNAGLWSYLIGDTVKFVSKDPYRIVVTGRIQHFLSAFGEHVIVEEVEKAMLVALNNYPKARIKEFSVAPSFKNDSELPYHEWNIAFESVPENMTEFAETLDNEMRKQNIYYDDLITGNILQRLKIRVLPPNAFQVYMKSIGKLGGQNKVPRLSNDRNIADKLTSLVQSV